MTFKFFCRFSPLKVGISLRTSFDLFSDEPITNLTNTSFKLHITKTELLLVLIVLDQSKGENFASCSKKKRTTTTHNRSETLNCIELS